MLANVNYVVFISKCFQTLKYTHAMETRVLQLNLYIIIET